MRERQRIFEIIDSMVDDITTLESFQIYVKTSIKKDVT